MIRAILLALALICTVPVAIVAMYAGSEFAGRDLFAEPPRAAAKFECPGPPTFNRPELKLRRQRFRFNTPVRVTNGFYEGMEGRLFEPMFDNRYGVLLTVSVGQPAILARVPGDYLEVIVKAEKE